MGKMTHTPTPWKWHPASEEGEHNGSVYSEIRRGHAYAVAMRPRYQTAEAWAADAERIVHCVNTHDALVEALRTLVENNAKGVTGEASRKAWMAARAALSQDEGK